MATLERPQPPQRDLAWRFHDKGHPLAALVYVVLMVLTLSACRMFRSRFPFV